MGRVFQDVGRVEGGQWNADPAFMLDPYPWPQPSWPYTSLLDFFPVISLAQIQEALLGQEKYPKAASSCLLPTLDTEQAYWPASPSRVYEWAAHLLL